MVRVFSCLILLMSSLQPALLSAAEPLSPLANKGKMLLEDQFERDSLGDWKVVIPTFEVRDGMLVSSQGRDDHGAVGRVYVPMQDVVMTFRFRLAGTQTFNVVFDDKNYRGSHAGHICRIAVTPRQIRLGDDKEGVMRNDIFEMRRDPAQKAAADKMIVDRGVAISATVEQQRWYEMTIEILGDQMQVSLDGKILGRLQSPGIAHPTKESVHFTVNGKEAQFDDVRIWTAVPVRQ